MSQPEFHADEDNIITVPPYLQFNLCILEQERKTEYWEVYGLRNKVLLGVVKWNSKWRQYCFYPANDTLYNFGCLNTLSWFCSVRNSIHAQQLRERRRG